MKDLYETKEKSFPIVEPLTNATKLELQPLKISKNTFLKVSLMTSEGTHFKINMFSGESKPHDFEIPEENKEYFIRSYDGGWVYQTSEHAPWGTSSQWITRIPENRHLGEKNWKLRDIYSVGCSEYSCLIIQHLWSTDRICFVHPLAKEIYERILNGFYSESYRAKMQADYKFEKKIPDLPEEFVDHNENPLAEYQKAVLAFALQEESTGLFMEQGTGKTPVSIARICTEARIKEKKDPDSKGYFALIIVPNQLRLNWYNEFNKFSTCPGVVSCVRGTKAQRERSLLYGLTPVKDAKFYAVITSYDSFSQDYEYYSYLNFDIAICDESQYFKSPKTKRWKYLSALVANGKVKRRMVLTGTPADKNQNDLWTQMEFMGPGKSGFRTYGAFAQFYTIYENVGRYNVEAGTRHLPLLQEILSRRCFQITKEEADLQLPDKLYSTYEIEMTPKQEEIYSKIKTQLKFEMEQAEKDNTMSPSVFANHALTKLLRLAQITSGFVKWEPIEDENGIVIKPGYVEQIENEEENPKIKAVKEIIAEQDPNCKFIVWCTYSEDLRALKKALGDSVEIFDGKTPDKKRDQILKDFNSNSTKLRGMLIQIQAGAEGLNLLGYDMNSKEEGSTYCGLNIRFSHSWSALKTRQAEDRSHRRGTKGPVKYVDLCVPNSIDTRMVQHVNAKREKTDGTIDVSSILKELLD